jgi:hypothetical protein
MVGDPKDMHFLDVQEIDSRRSSRVARITTVSPPRALLARYGQPFMVQLEVALQVASHVLGENTWPYTAMHYSSITDLALTQGHAH